MPLSPAPHTGLRQLEALLPPHDPWKPTIYGLLAAMMFLGTLFVTDIIGYLPQ